MLPAICKAESIAKAVEIAERSRRSAKVQVDEDSVVGLVNSILLAAVKERASDIHIEPLKDRLRIRLRVDGVLNQYKEYPVGVVPSLTSRLKVMANVDITEKRRHQGGRIFFQHDEGQLDLRVSFYVTINGEKVVLRLMNSLNEMLGMQEIGMAPRMLKRFMDDALESPSGVVIITGPHGIGKNHHGVRLHPPSQRSQHQHHHRGRAGGGHDSGHRPMLH